MNHFVTAITGILALNSMTTATDIPISTLYTNGLALRIAQINDTFPNLTPRSAQTSTASCLNEQCWENQSVCFEPWEGSATDADFATERTVQKLIADYCGAVYGHAIEHGTVIYHDFTLNGVTGTLGLRNYSPQGSWDLSGNLCSEGFSGLLDACDSAGTGFYGGWTWYYWKDLTFVFGVNGDEPSEFCGGPACE